MKTVVILIVTLTALPAWATPNDSWGPEAAHDALTTAVDERVRAALPAELVLAATRAPIGWPLSPRDAVAVEWRTPPRAGTISVQLVVRYADGSRRVGWAQVDLRALHPVVVSRRALVAGNTVVPDDLVTALRPTGAGEGFTLSPEALVGARVLRDVAAGLVITSADVVAPAPVARGAEIAIQVRHAHFRVSTRGVLEREARPGERAFARLADGSRIVSGRLVDNTTLLIEGTP